jgi:hypothetical protein
MISSFLVFSYIPLFSLIFVFIYPFLSAYAFIFSLILFTLLGLLVIIGIITLDLRFRTLATAFFASGILFLLKNPYLLAFGVILSWSFYEIWYISFKYNQLDQEYSTYPSDSIEKQKLLKTFQVHFFSFILLIWIVLSISWGILLIANNFYVELGTGEFGTLGITLSIAIILLIYLVQKYIRSYPRKQSSMQ